MSWWTWGSLFGQKIPHNRETPNKDYVSMAHAEAIFTDA